MGFRDTMIALLQRAPTDAEAEQVVRDVSRTALTAWRENRGGGLAGMQSVVNAIANRSKRDRVSFAAECARRLQFSSMTAAGDPELTLWEPDGDAQAAQALDLAACALAGTLKDITGGAVDYYAPRSIRSDKTYTTPDGAIVPFPHGWNPLAVKYCCTVAGQLFFR